MKTYLTLEYLVNFMSNRVMSIHAGIRTTAIKTTLVLAMSFSGLALSGCSNKGDMSTLSNDEITAVEDKQIDAVRSLHDLAMDNVADAQGRLAQEFYDGIVVKRNDAKAYYWAERAHSNKDGLGTLVLARMTYYGEEVPQDTAKAVAMLESIKDSRIEVNYILGKMLLEQASDNYNDYQKAIGYIKKAADNGSAVAQYDYAENLRLGLKNTPNLDKKMSDSIKRSVHEYMFMASSSNGDNAAAYRQMGLYFVNGFGVDKNEANTEKGMKLLAIATGLDDPIAKKCIDTNICELDAPVEVKKTNE